MKIDGSRHIRTPYRNHASGARLEPRLNQMDGKWSGHQLESNDGQVYQLGELVEDSGGMAEIYSVMNSTHLCKISRDTPVAKDNIKNEIRILLQLGSEEGRRCRMVSSGNRLDHPFMILQLVEGHDLHFFLKGQKKPFGFTDFVLMATDLLLTIEDIHVMNIIHRDIKPKNIMYNPSNEDYYRSVGLDFGISLELGEALIDLPTSKHLQCKSGGFSPPEAADERQSVTEAFDVYSVGAIMYYCATMKNPPNTPSDLGLHPRAELNSFHKGLNDWIAKCTHPLLKLRFKTAREAIDALHLIQPPEVDVWIDDFTENKNKMVNNRNYTVDTLNSSSQPFDLVIVMDSTETMEPHLSKMKQDLEQLANLLFSVYTNLKITVIGLGDYESVDILQKIDGITSRKKLEKAFKKMKTIPGGGDDAEAYEFVFSILARAHQWREDAVKLTLVIGDSFSHGFSNRLPYQRGPWGEEREANVENFKQQFHLYCDRHGGHRQNDWVKFETHNFKARDNHGAKGSQIIDTNNPLLKKLHTQSETGYVHRPNIDRAICMMRDRYPDMNIHSLYCGTSALSSKFFQYLAVRGEGVKLNLSEEHDIVAALCGLVLTYDPENYELFLEELNDEQTSLLQPATTMVQTQPFD